MQLQADTLAACTQLNTCTARVLQPSQLTLGLLFGRVRRFVRLGCQPFGLSLMDLQVLILLLTMIFTINLRILVGYSWIFYILITYRLEIIGYFGIKVKFWTFFFGWFKDKLSFDIVNLRLGQVTFSLTLVELIKY